MNPLGNGDKLITASRLVLGTAQLGLPYGIANRTGQPDHETAESIVKTAWQGGIREFDTAQAYGESEAVLGRALTSLGISHDARIITKLDPTLNPLREQDITGAVKRSLEYLQAPSLYGLMLHREEWLDHLNNGLEKTLRALVLDDIVQHLGISLYSPARALQALKFPLFDLLQVPANILDRRFADAGVFKLAEEKGKQVYIRSVFLQGLLLMAGEDLPATLALAKGPLGKIDSLCRRYQYSRQEIALLYIQAHYPQAKIIIGAETPIQLAQNLAIWKDSPASILDFDEFDGLSVGDERIINPALWPQ